MNALTTASDFPRTFFIFGGALLIGVGILKMLLQFSEPKSERDDANGSGPSEARAGGSTGGSPGTWRPARTGGSRPGPLGIPAGLLRKNTAALRIAWSVLVIAFGLVAIGVGTGRISFGPRQGLESGPYRE